MDNSAAKLYQNFFHDKQIENQHCDLKHNLDFVPHEDLSCDAIYMPCVAADISYSPDAFMNTYYVQLCNCLQN